MLLVTVDVWERVFGEWRTIRPGHFAVILA